ncbi:MAG: tail fiber domain-containing protein [Blastocatellia bacterium]
MRPATPSRLVGATVQTKCKRDWARAGSTQLCRNANNEISTSSSLRYKTAIRAYRHGLDFIQRLQPISFTWKDGGLRDLGFGAEDVAKVDPLLVIYNKEGQVEGVKYDRLSALLVNAVKEQQAQIEELKAQVAALLKQASQQKAAGQQ